MDVRYTTASRSLRIVGLAVAAVLVIAVLAYSRRDQSSPFSRGSRPPCGETIYGISSSGGVLYLGASTGIIAFDPELQTARWHFDTGSTVMLAPTIADSRVHFGSHDTYVYAADLNGNLLWRYNVGNMVFGSPTVATGTVYVGSAAKFVALDAATGTLKWTIDLGTWVEISWSREIVDGVIYLGTAHGEVIAVDATTGTEHWRYHVPPPTSATPQSAVQSAWIHDPPVPLDGVVYFASLDGFIYAIDAATGEHIWRFATGGSAYPSPVVVDGTVYAASNGEGGFLYALDARTGALTWKQATGGNYSPVAVVDGIVYASYDRVHGRIGAFAAASGEQLWEYAYSDSVFYEFSRPVIQDGILYAGDRGTYCQGLFAINAETGSLLWHWLGQ